MSSSHQIRAGRAAELPLSVMGQSVGARVVAVTGIILLLWLAVAWAAAQP